MKGKKTEGNYMGLGLLVGFCLGLAFGQFVLQNPAVGMCFGMCIGTAVGAFVGKKEK